MVLVSEGSVLSWSEISDNLEKIKAKLIKELISVYNKFKTIENDTFKWGDEIELTLINFDHTNRKCHLLLKSEEFFDYLNKFKAEAGHDSDLEKFYFHNEYTKYMIEAIPAQPSDGDVNSLCNIEENMKLRKKFIQSFLGEGEHVISLTSFPRLGCKDFTKPPKNQTNIYGRYASLFYSNEIIMNRKLFLSATFNKIDRIESQPVIYVPIFTDIKTMRPFVEELPNGMLSMPDHIYMDHDGFAMGCSCIQVNIFFSSINRDDYYFSANYF